MARDYRNNWTTKFLTINFNHKQWRQDFGYFVRKKEFWVGTTMVTRARILPKDKNKLVKDSVKQFKVYDPYGREVIVQFENENKVVYTSHPDIVKEYFKSRGFKNEV